jgi:UDP-N-acetylmuramate: L-alanyl-gamma-D-glutamyl-meso-diaminopimelate ligase
MNNLEFDHADIFPDLDAIKQQFHFLVRTVPGNGLIIRHGEDIALQDVLSKGCWTPVTTFSGRESAWQADLINLDGSRFAVKRNGVSVGEVCWDLLGKHNVDNAMAALLAALHAGVPVDIALQALPLFKNVKRRLEIKACVNGITLYDDFAHHPTAIATTLAGLRAKLGKARMIVVLEFGSYTMRLGVHKDTIKHALSTADMVFCKRPISQDWNVDSVLENSFDDVTSLVEKLVIQLKSGDHVIVMSNSGFDDIHTKLLNAIERRFVVHEKASHIE